VLCSERGSSRLMTEAEAVTPMFIPCNKISILSAGSKPEVCIPNQLKSQQETHAIHSVCNNL
jgi:hypothetical protein